MANSNKTYIHYALVLFDIILIVSSFLAGMYFTYALIALGVF